MSPRRCPSPPGDSLGRYVSALAPRRRDRLWTDQLGEELRPPLQRLTLLRQALPQVVDGFDAGTTMREHRLPCVWIDSQTRKRRPTGSPDVMIAPGCQHDLVRVLTSGLSALTQDRLHLGVERRLGVSATGRDRRGAVLDREHIVAPFTAGHGIEDL